MPYQPYQNTWNPYLQQTQQQYMPVMPSLTQPTVQGNQQPTNGVIKVNGRDSAMQFQMPPNSMSPALFDNNGKVFYIVSTDGTGTKSLEAFDYKPHADEPPVEIDGAQFVSRREFDEFTAKVNAAIGAINGVHGPVQPAEQAVAGDVDGQGAVVGQPERPRPAAHGKRSDVHYA